MSSSTNGTSFTEMMRERQDRIEQWKKSRRNGNCNEDPDDEIEFSIERSARESWVSPWSEACVSPALPASKKACISAAILTMQTPAKRGHNQRLRPLVTKALTDVKKRKPSKLLSRKSAAGCIGASLNGGLIAPQTPGPRVGVGGPIIGTPDYLAPEVLLRKPHSSAVDVWALGVCLYEFLVGCPPFIDETVEKVFDNILERAIEYPDEGDGALSAEAVETVERLLEPQVDLRPSAETLRELPLFKHLDWDRVRSLEPPWIPQPADESDTACFDEERAQFEVSLSML
ncbi:serine/threonine-protein kinase greatwall-like [Tropilaelaps mercedesae]|uniref:Serine/threonine-protein kinase greatwall n=1 Tax=Tropilaelaps mercedesae TaxID=418985 RepID=A0A1V9XWV7_9ACAR|nr:serine/threonine-protein kinase greatwall-like [Tropilaelaps mercedesae]